MIRVNRPRFAPGTILVTTRAQEQLPQYELQRALARHIAGDWGDCAREDADANEAALQNGDRLLSVYHTADHIKFWIITEADRRATTILLPEDY